AHGDLRENSEFKAALERQQFFTSRLSHLRLRLGKLSDVSEKDIPRDRVGFGSRVTVHDLDTKKKEVYALTLGEFVDGDEGADENHSGYASSGRLAARFSQATYHRPATVSAKRVTEPRRPAVRTGTCTTRVPGPRSRRIVSWAAASRVSSARTRPPNRCSETP